MAWQQLITIMEEGADIDRAEASKVPVVCPYDLTTLKPTPDGKLFCPWAGDYTYPDDGIVP